MRRVARENAGAVDWRLGVAEMTLSPLALGVLPTPRGLSLLAGPLALPTLMILQYHQVVNRFRHEFWSNSRSILQYHQPMW